MRAYNVLVFPAAHASATNRAEDQAGEKVYPILGGTTHYALAHELDGVILRLGDVRWAHAVRAEVAAVICRAAQ